jgi:hypothetical protein
VSGLDPSNGYEGVLRSDHILSKKFKIPEKTYLYVNFSLDNNKKKDDPILGDFFIYPKGKNGLRYKTKSELLQSTYFFKIKIKKSGLTANHKLYMKFAIIQPEDEFTYSKTRNKYL